MIRFTKWHLARSRKIRSSPRYIAGITVCHLRARCGVESTATTTRRGCPRALFCTACVSCGRRSSRGSSADASGPAGVRRNAAGNSLLIFAAR
ncbi:hypothetical protein GWI33_021587 [Rhynchophorus ferrugineus]|uniref:Uncharacterized protein n=1 Tax=Rhynchophorus ferrugineus TaxID=354439 RepID=A0A834IVV9_RHYFE|nr:hypothetical protein GWI33_021587 [Rhynchophorus ferrugineus]